MGLLCAFLSSCTWAVGSAKYSQVAQTNSPFAVNFTRALIALPLFVLTVLIMSGGLSGAHVAFSELRWHHLGWFTLSMICSYGLADVLFMWSTRSLGVPGALAIASTYPLVTAMGSVFVGGEKLGWVQLFGLCAIVGGVVVVILNAPGRVRTPAPTPLGEKLSTKKAGVILALCTAVLWAGNTYSVAKGGADVNAAVGNSLRMVLALVLTFTMGRLFAPGTPVVLRWKTVRPSLWIFVFEAYGGSLVYMYGLANSPLVLGSALTSLAPVISVPVAVALKLEKPSFPRTLGVAAVVMGLWLLTPPLH